MQTDVLIVGSGCAGLYCAMHLPSDKRVTVITKSAVEDSDSYLAQGGICTLRDDNDFDSFFEDTLKAGHYQNDRESVSIMINSSQDVIRDLVDIGVDFNKTPDGDFDYTREGAHSKKRILYHKDITGKEITSKLYQYVKTLSNVTIIENNMLVDVVIKEGKCCGGVIKTQDGNIDAIFAHCTVFATGGIGGLYRHSTNFRHLTGDALAISLKHGIKLKNVNYVQIHPTTLYTQKKEDRRFLISESVRGEGAKLYNKNMERFVDELLPRDLLTKEIRKQMERDGTDFVWEDLRPIGEKELKDHFPNIVEHCREMGYDVFSGPIPVVPAQHYFMGGVEIDKQGNTSMPMLYAIGETACNGVHGKNRLASNSLLESLVFAKRAASDIAQKLSQTSSQTDTYINFDEYNDIDKLQKEYSLMVRREIDRMANVTK